MTAYWPASTPRRPPASPVKIKPCSCPGSTTTRRRELLDWALGRGHELRFIEQMALDADHGWDRADMVTAAEIRELLAERFSSAPDAAPRDGAPAERSTSARAGPTAASARWGSSPPSPRLLRRLPAHPITAEGGVRSCLFSNEETDLLGPMRAGADDDDIAQLWRGAMWAKPAGHEIEPGPASCSPSAP